MPGREEALRLSDSYKSAEANRVGYSVMKSNSLLMEEDSDLALDGPCAVTPAGVFGTLL